MDRNEFGTWHTARCVFFTTGRNCQSRQILNPSRFRMVVAVLMACPSLV